MRLLLPILWCLHVGAVPAAGSTVETGTLVNLPPDIMKKLVFGKVVTSQLSREIQLVGSVAYDQDRYAIVGPLVTGRVDTLIAKLGDHVRKGDTLAQIESADIGHARADYLTARARALAADAEAKRENNLADQHISSEREREIAVAELAQCEANVQAAAVRLQALGLVGPFTLENPRNAGRVALRAPMSGTVVERRIALGQAVAQATDAFVLADLEHLWVMLDVYEKDLPLVRVGQEVEVFQSTHAMAGRLAKVTYIESSIDMKTRTASVRIAVDNPDGSLRPGEFVTAKLRSTGGVARTALMVPRQAVASVGDKATVFVRAGMQVKQVPVVVGRASEAAVEVLSGLAETDEVVVEGVFYLKSQVMR